MLNKQVEVAVGRLLIEPSSVVRVVATVPITVEDAARVVSTSTVPVVFTTVVPATEVATTDPSAVIVVGRTVTAVMTAVVSTGTLVIVCVTTTVSKVDTGKVMVPVTGLSAPVAVALPKGTLLSRGCKVAEVMVGKLVGKGCTGGLPSVSRVVMSDYRG
jgi:hypothetical protein